MDPLLQEITPLCKIYDKYVKKTEEIDLFIKTAQEQKDFVENVDVKEEYKGYILGLRELSNSVVLYNAAIISIYGSYELFIDEILKTYIDYLKNRYDTYEKFPAKLKTKHLSKAAEFLSNPQRFQNMGLNERTIISALEASYIQDQSSVLLDELLLTHGGNLNSKQLCALLGEYGFKNSIQQLMKHSSFGQFFNIAKHNDSDNNTTFPLLDQIVVERNKVGHGWIIDERISFALLRERYLPFINELCCAVKDLFVSQIIQNHIDKKNLVKFDPLLHIWKNGEVIGVNSKNFRLRINEFLYCSTSENWNYKVQIKNLKNNEQDRKEIRAANKDITIQIDRKIKDNYVLWGYVKDS